MDDLSRLGREWDGEDLEVFVVLPASPFLDSWVCLNEPHFLVAKLKMSKTALIPEIGWLGDETMGGEVALMIAEDDIRLLPAGQIVKKE
jgi:hypothetical protein